MPCTVESTKARATAWTTAFAGWGGSLAALLAREDEGLMLWLLPFLLTVAIVGTIALLLVYLLPDLARVYAIGYRHGRRDANNGDAHPESSPGGRLTLVHSGS